MAMILCRRFLGILILAAMALLAPGAAAQTLNGGTLVGNAPFYNVFGWQVGSVTVTTQYIEVTCNCWFVGSPSMTESLPVQSCAIKNVSSVPVLCYPPSAICPHGDVGQEQTVVVECCLDFKLSVAGTTIGASALCTSVTFIFQCCPP